MLFNIFTLDFWINILYSLPAIMIGLSFHEFAHAFAAHKMGDDTARNMGRMTLNPLAHFDPLGTVCILLLGFGWAKPVPVNPNNYRGNRRKADIIVSLAGITMNFAIAFVAMFLLYFLVYVLGMQNVVVSGVIMQIVYLNLGLMVFNLIPVPPLDGSHVLEDLLIPVVGAKPFYFLRQHSMILLIIVLMVLNTTGILGIVMQELAGLLMKLFDLVFSVYKYAV
ncbi:MAG: site-2 protease family protein [Clostridia bacterium]|nr:site-2 protease family protein [Clostridia bacterium]